MEIPIKNTLTPSLLGLPYTVREAIFIDVLDWVGLELVLHVNACRDCRDPRATYQRSICCLCAARRPPVKILTRPREPNTEDDAHITETAQRIPVAAGLPTLFNSSKARRARIATLIRYPTFLNLSATCKIIRQEVGELYWMRSEFNVCADYGPFGLGDGGQPDMSLAVLDKPFANGPIGTNIQILTLRLRFSDSFNIGAAGNTPENIKIRSDVCESLGRIFANIPKLRHLNLHVSHSLLQGSALREWGVPNIILSQIKGVKKLTSIHISGNKETVNRVFKVWRDELNSSIVVTKQYEKFEDRWKAPICHARVLRLPSDQDTAQEPPDDLIELVGSDVSKADLRYFINSLKIPELSYLDKALFGDLRQLPMDTP